jgi:hypothetical protein
MRVLRIAFLRCASLRGIAELRCVSYSRRLAFRTWLVKYATRPLTYAARARSAWRRGRWKCALTALCAQIDESFNFYCKSRALETRLCIHIE